ncbi:MAG: hypothetical protein NXI24_04620 [bacterium]|nr:hypothetical protein [bacterium]
MHSNRPLRSSESRSRRPRFALLSQTLVIAFVCGFVLIMTGPGCSSQNHRAARESDRRDATGLDGGRGEYFEAAGEAQASDSSRASGKTGIVDGQGTTSESDEKERGEGD